MKKLIAILMLAVMLVGCGSSSESDAGDGENQKRFVLVEHTWDYEIMVDSETKVMYVVSNGSYNHGTFTLMVDENGKPLTWDGDLE